jgi:hypothetical protein
VQSRHIAAIAQRRHLDRPRTGLANHQRVERESVLRINRAVAGRQERFRQQRQQVVGAVAETQG